MNQWMNHGSFEMIFIPIVFVWERKREIIVPYFFYKRERERKEIYKNIIIIIMKKGKAIDHVNV